MDWDFLVRNALRYTVLYAGATVAAAWLLPYSGYLLLGCVALGVGLVGKAVAQGGRGTPTAGEAGEVAMALDRVGADALRGRTPSAPSGPGQVFYAIGLLAFGLAGLVALM